jgi:kynurenine formamidase
MRSKAPWIVLGVAALAGIAAAAATPPSSSPMDLSKAKRGPDARLRREDDLLAEPPSTFKLQQLADGATEGGYYYRMNSFCAPEHGGTHLDAPSHFAKDGWAADQIPLGRLVARGVVIDVTKQAAADPDYRLTAADLRAWEKRNGSVPAGSIVLLRTGWGSRWPDRRKYGRRHAGRDVEPALPVVRKSPRRSWSGSGSRGPGLDTASIDRSVEGLHRPPEANGANVPD